MNKKVMLVNVTDDESRIAIVENNVLQEMLIEHQTREQIKNNIYKGVVVQIQTALQAAFVDFGSKRHGFLPSSEINPNLFRSKDQRGPIQTVLQRGQSLVVQVTREPVDNKGAALSTNISLPGRFMVLMPDSNKGGISKKIEDQQERDRLKGFLSGIESEDHAIIIRTAGIGRDLLELKKDYTHLKKNWEEIQALNDQLERPGLIQEEDDVVTRTLRDYYAEDIKEIWVDNPEAFQKALQFLKKTTPRRQKDLKLFVGDRSLFATYHIEKQVEQLTARVLSLKSGGSIVIEQTEALVSIDVNSGKSNQEENIEDTALRTNLEAAEEIARQVRLRNLAGLIVVDFIDMETESSRRKVEQQIQTAMVRDKAQRRYGNISQFGLMEMSRQRLAVGISRTIESICPTCNGKGKISSLLASTNLIIRSIREMAARGNLLKLEGELPLNLANHLLNERRQSITDLELEFGIHISLKGDPNLTVFEERQLQPFYKGKPSHRYDRDSQTKEKQKPATRNKKGRRPEPETQKSADAEKKQAVKTKARKDKEPKETKHRTKRGKAGDSEPVLSGDANAASESNRERSEGSDTAGKQRENGTLHPACLFQDVQELSGEDLQEVTTSFENRMKGKADDQPFVPIDSKYLWRSVESQNDMDRLENGIDTPKEETEDQAGEERQILQPQTDDGRADSGREKTSPVGEEEAKSAESKVQKGRKAPAKKGEEGKKAAPQETAENGKEVPEETEASEKEVPKEKEAETVEEEKGALEAPPDKTGEEKSAPAKTRKTAAKRKPSPRKTTQAKKETTVRKKPTPTRKTATKRAAKKSTKDTDSVNMKATAGQNLESKDKPTRKRATKRPDPESKE